MAIKQGDIVIFFADISNSTTLYDRIGDTAARSIVRDCFEILTKSIKKHEGKLLKSIGDGAMAAFSNPDSSAEAACEMHDGVERYAQKKAVEIVIALRIGIHCGAVLQEKKDVFGDVVNIASRLMDEANIGQTIVSKAFVEGLSDRLRTRAHFIDRVRIKGKLDRFDIYQITRMDDYDATQFASVTKQLPVVPRNSFLKLEYNGNVLELNEKRLSVTIGRNPNCDLFVDEEMASRHHVRIEMRHGYFYVIDQSTNGTYLKDQPTGKESFIRREELPLLQKSGAISLGLSFRKSPKKIISFVVAKNQSTTT